MNEIDSTRLVDLDTFEKFAGPKIDKLEELQFNYCPDCKVPMEMTMSGYQCKICNIIQEGVEPRKDLDDIGSSAIRSTTGSSAGRMNNINDDYTRTQYKAILEQLHQCARLYQGPAFSNAVLVAVAEQYNRIQKFVAEDEYNDRGEVTGKKKFVKRGDLKDEILCALIYFEGIRFGIVRKKKDISVFMRMTTSGFARGEDIVRTLHAEGKIDIPIDNEPIEGFLDRYLETLNLDDTHSQFIVDIVQRSEERKIGMNSQISSKIVGALWIVIVKKGLKITDKELEKAADDTRKGTFMKFYNVVFENYRVFADIFNKHGVKK